MDHVLKGAERKINKNSLVFDSVYKGILNKFCSISILFNCGIFTALCIVFN